MIFDYLITAGRAGSLYESPAAYGGPYGLISRLEDDGIYKKYITLADHA